MTNRFVLFGVPRVGSNYLISLLNRHPDLRCHFEVFSRDNVYLSWPKEIFATHPERLRFRDRIWRDREPVRFLEQLLSAGQEPVQGFNIFPDQNDEILRYVCQSDDYAYVFIRRGNLLRSYISQTIAQNNNAWNSTRSHSLTLADKRFAIDTSHFDRYQKRIQSFYRRLMNQLETTGRSYHVVEYEQFVRDGDILNRCFDFLGLPPVSGQGDTVFQKENRETVEQIVINYSQLKDYCRERGLTAWLTP